MQGFGGKFSRTFLYFKGSIWQKGIRSSIGRSCDVRDIFLKNISKFDEVWHILHHVLTHFTGPTFLLMRLFLVYSGKWTPLSHSPTQIRPLQSPLEKPCVGIVWGAPNSTKPCVGSPTPSPHKVFIIFRPHAIPTQSPPILMYICNPHTFWYILFQSSHILYNTSYTC